MLSRKLFYCLLLVNCMLVVIYYLETLRIPSAEREVAGWRRGSQRHFVKTKTRILPEDFCAFSYFLMVMVHSAPANTERRRLIRATWGRETEDAGVFFLLGTTADPAVQDEVVAESELHDDIVQGDFLDTPLNRTLKSLMMLRVTITHCYDSRYLLKTTDEHLVHPGNVVRELPRSEARDLLVGRLLCRRRPERNPSRRDYSPRYLYPDPFYPPHLDGRGYLMGMQVARDLYAAAWYTPTLHLEEVFLTGLCAREAKIRRKTDGRFVRSTDDSCLLKRAFAVYDVVDLRSMWTVVSTGSEGECEGVAREKFCHLGWLFNSVFKPSSLLSRRSCT